jgi:Tol biopolymer transport system component
VVFKSWRKGRWNLFQKEASGDRAEQPLLETEEQKSPSAWSPDGRFVLYAANSLKTGWDIWALPLAGDRKPFPVVQTLFDEMSGQFSPDGRWVAYHSNESQQVQIYVRPFPGHGGVRQVSTLGGSQPRWRSDGKELFYVGPDARLMAVPIAFDVESETLDVGAPVPLFRTRLASGENIGSNLMSAPQYVVASDGRFLMNLAVEEATPPPLTVVLNWDAALKK